VAGPRSRAALHAAAGGRASECAPNPATAGFDALLLPEGGETLKPDRPPPSAGCMRAPVRLLAAGWGRPFDQPASRRFRAGSPPRRPAARIETRFQRPRSSACHVWRCFAFERPRARLGAGEGVRNAPCHTRFILNPSGFTGVDGLFPLNYAARLGHAGSRDRVHRMGNTVRQPTAPQDFAGFATLMLKGGAVRGLAKYPPDSPVGWRLLWLSTHSTSLTRRRRKAPGLRY